MKRFWEIIMTARGGERIYCYPFLLFFRMITPLYQYFSRRNLQKRLKRRSRDWKAQAISVGNVTVGGCGKTPIVAWLAQHLISQGKRVAIVHSGYGRRSDKELIISPGRITDYAVAETGDEVQMMGAILPEAAFAIGRDKKKMVALVDLKFSPDVILIDDGFQRLDIAKDRDIVVVETSSLLSSSAEGISALRLFPGGFWREPLSSLKRAAAIFVVDPTGAVDKKAITDNIQKYNDNAPVVFWRFSLSGASCGDRVVGLDDLRERRPMLFAGIGSYPRLLAMIEASGIKPVGEYNFGDHYDYDKSDIDHIMRMAREFKADCYLTTAKDAVKLPHDAFDKPVYVLQLAVAPDDIQLVEKLLDRQPT